MPVAAGLHYLDTGRGEPLVLVPGLGMTTAFWQPIVPLLRRKHRVLTIDLPGFGGSPACGRSIADLAHRVAAWHHAVGLPEVHWVGNSLGTQVLLHLGARHPERVASLTLAGTTLPATFALTALPRAFAGLLKEPSPVWRLMMGALVQTGPLRLLRAVAMARRDDPLSILSQIPAPVLLVQGSEDALVTDAQLERLRRALPHARLERLKGATHTLIYRRPQAFVEVLERFLLQIRAPRPSSWTPESRIPTSGGRPLGSRAP